MTQRYGKEELVTKVKELSALGEEKALSKVEIKRVLGLIEEAVAELLEEPATLDLRGFIRLETYMRDARQGVNPKTGEQIEIPEKMYAKAKAKFLK